MHLLLVHIFIGIQVEIDRMVGRRDSCTVAPSEPLLTLDLRRGVNLSPWIADVKQLEGTRGIVLYKCIVLCGRLL